MGLSSTATGTTQGFQFCIFDLRRGQQEGQELDKILFFSPSECPYSAQLSVIGLCEGIITFTRIFSPEAACEVIEAEKHTHVFYEAEPDIWMVMVLEKNKDTESIWRCDALRETLKEIHSLFMMFHGTLRGFLEKQPSGELARSHLFSFVTDYINGPVCITATLSSFILLTRSFLVAEFHVGKRIQMPSFRECLRERGTVQMLTISREVAIEIQSLITVLGSSVGNTICNSLILFQDLLVSTTLSPDDTANIFTYAVMRLTPHALSSNISSWSYLKRATSAPNVAAISSLPTSAVEESHYTPRDTSPGGQRPTFHIPRPLQRDKWSKGKDGFVIPDVWDSEGGSSNSLSPTVRLHETEERMCLCVYQHKSLTIILLVPVSLLANGGQTLAFVKKQLVENAFQKIVNVEEKLSRGWGGENAYHVAGYRYLLIDDDRRISRASPPGKVTTLTKESLLALNRLREEVDLEKARGKRDHPEHEKDLEVCIRARNNAWVIAKLTRGRELYMVLEKASETLLYASDALEKFSNRYCDGAFSA